MEVNDVLNIIMNTTGLEPTDVDLTDNPLDGTTLSLIDSPDVNETHNNTDLAIVVDAGLIDVGQMLEEDAARVEPNEIAAAALPALRRSNRAKKPSKETRMQRHAISRIVFEANPSSTKICNDECPFEACEAVECYFHYPLKIILPARAGFGCCKWVYVLNYGGGIVEGDVFKIELTVKEKCSVLWTTQSFTKVYSCNNGKKCIQELACTVHSDSLLCILPDPVVCFEHSHYKQLQEVHLKHDSNVVLLDWFTSGRQARGEHWDFKQYQSTTILKMDEKVLLKEAVCIQDTPFLLKKDAMKSYAVIGLCILFGPYLAQVVLKTIQNLSACEEYGTVPKHDVVIGVSPFCTPQDSKPAGCVIRFSAVSTYQAYLEIINILQPIFHILGGNPLENK